MEIENLNDGIYTLTVNDGCFETVRTFNIAQGTILDESDNPTNCFDRVLCQHPTNNNISYPVDVCWSGYYSDPEVSLDETTCVATVECMNNVVQLPYFNPSQLIGHEGGVCYCDELRLCTWHIFDQQSTSFIDAYGVTHNTENEIIDLMVNETKVREGQFFTGEEPASTLGGSCDPDELAVGQVCGNQGVVCEECGDCIPSNSSTPTMPNGDCENCICFVEVTCGDHTRTIEGTIEFDFNTDVDPNLDIAGCRLCEGGNFCKKTINCKTLDFGSVFIKDAIFTVVSFNPTTACPAPDCFVEYRCDDVVFHDFCNEDCTVALTPPDPTEFGCIADTYIEGGPCPSFAPPVIEKFVNDNGGIIYTYQADIINGDNFVIANVYPNPFDDEVNVTINSNYDDAVYFTITDALGRVIISEKKSIAKGQNKIKLDCRNGMFDGLYFLNINNHNGISHSAKMLKRKIN